MVVFENKEVDSSKDWTGSVVFEKEDGSITLVEVL